MTNDDKMYHGTEIGCPICGKRYPHSDNWTETIERLNLIHAGTGLLDYVHRSCYEEYKQIYSKRRDSV